MSKTFWYIPVDELPQSMRMTNYGILSKQNIFDSIYTGDIKSVQIMINNGTYINTRNDKDQTLLHYAALYNQTNIAIFLISLGADLNARDYSKQIVIDIIKERNPILYDQLNEYTISSLLITPSNQEQEDIQVQELGVSEYIPYCCITM